MPNVTLLVELRYNRLIGNDHLVIQPVAEALQFG